MLVDGRRFNFTIIENDIIDDVERFDKNDLLCYMVLCRYANNDSAECFPSYKTISEKMRVGVSTAMKAVKSLVDKGVISVSKRKGEDGGDTSNLYTILNINKKADTGKVSAEKKNNSNNSIYQNNKNYASKNKPKTRMHNCNETFSKYSPEELEKMLQENQANRDSSKEVDNNIVEDNELEVKEEFDIVANEVAEEVKEDKKEYVSFVPHFQI